MGWSVTSAQTAQRREKGRTPQPVLVIASGPPQPLLLRQRVRAKLEMRDAAGIALAAFVVEDGPRFVGGPQATALPTGRRVVDPPIEPARVEPERIRHAHH